MSARFDDPEGADQRDVLERVLGHAFFSGMSEEEKTVVALSILPGETRWALFEPGEMIFCEGESANRFYLLEDGTVQLEFHEPGDETFPFETLRAGDVLGFSWLFPPFLWSYHARALERSQAIILNGAHLLVVAESNKQFGYDLMKRVSQIAIRPLRSVRRNLISISRQLHKARSLQSG